jgi:hypothetical protein
MPNDPAASKTTTYPSGNPWPLLDRLRCWLPSASITPHASNIGADALDALAEIERLREALAWIAGPEPDALAHHPVGGRSPEKANDARAAKAKESLAHDQ